MDRALLTSQFEILEEPGEALVADIDDSPDGIVARIRSGLVLSGRREYSRERRMVKRV